MLDQASGVGASGLGSGLGPRTSDPGFAPNCGILSGQLSSAERFAIANYRVMISESSPRESAMEVLAELSFTLMLKFTVIVALVSTA